MLYLHCGWSKTGTKSLQAALLRWREPLAAAGLLYPDLWLHHFGEQDISHNDLFTRIDDGSQAAIAELRELLEAHAEQDVLISAEIVTDLAMREDARERLARAVSTAREVMPVTCIWTLRRFDEFMHSRYLQLVALGLGMPDPAKFLEDADGNRLFAGMVEVEGQADRCVYLNYDAGGRHNLELLSVAGAPPRAAREIEVELVEGSRKNPSLSRKQVAAVLHCGALAQRAGLPLARSRLIRAFEAEEFAFDRDSRCELVGSRVRDELCARALLSARAARFQPYTRFFEHDRPSGLPASADIGPDSVTDADLERLALHLEEFERA